MRKLFGLLVAIVAVIPCLAHSVDSCGRAERLKRLYAAGLLPNGLPPATLIEAVGDTDVLHVDLDLEGVPSTKTISGTVTYTVKSMVNGLNAFTVMLHSNYTISSVLLDGRSITTTTVATNTRRANFDTTFNAGDTFTLSFTYSGVAPTAAGFGSILMGNRTGTTQYWETLSEPYYAMTWWPAKENNTDKFTATIGITVPSALKACSNGVLTSTTALSGSRTKYLWTCNYPIVTYLVSIGATNYNQWTATWNYNTTSMPVMFYIWPEQDTGSNRAAAEAVLPMLTAYSNRFGIYPFSNEKYGIYQFTFGGGMEHQTMTGQINFSESLSSHELGHQWWGDMITCGRWEDIWLNEGFATYCEAIWLETKPGSTGLPALQAAMAARVPSSVNGTVTRFDTTSVGSIFSSTFSYRKGSWVLHMLRHVMGETNFWAAMADYRTQFAYKSALSTDFAAVMSARYGSDMSWYFTPWLDQPGAPAYSIATRTSTINGQNYLSVNLRQTQKTLSSTYPYYKMPVDFKLTDGAGTRTVVLQNAAVADQWFMLPITGSASGLTVDPDSWILKAGSSATHTNTAEPPKIVAVTNGGRRAGEVFKVYFSRDVNITAADITLTSGGQPVPFRLSYVNSVATIIVKGKPVDFSALQLSVAPTVTSYTGGIALDGEGTTLPSGDGLAGGAFSRLVGM